MKLRSVLLAFFVIGVAVAGGVRTRSHSNNEQKLLAELQNSKDRGSLNWHVQVAKVKGQGQVTLPGPNVEYVTDVHSLDEVLLQYGVVVAQPISHLGYVHDANLLATWYRFKILENITGRPLPKCTFCSPEGESLPQELSSLGEDEIAVPVFGGTAVIEGVRVTMANRDFPPFDPSKKYLLFLSTGQSGKVGFLSMGPVAILTIDSEGRLEPASLESHPILSEIAFRCSNSLETFRTFVQSRSTQR